MSNWIDEEAEKYRAKKELEERKEDLILRSEHWSDVRLQIEKDVDQINNHPDWKQVLNGVPLKIVVEHGGYSIQKERLPAIGVFVYNKDDAIEIETKIRKTYDGKTESRKEVFEIDSDGERIYLKGDNATLHIPEETAKYILMPIIKALNGTL